MPFINFYTKATTLSRSEDERGASLVEYALLVGLIAMVCVVAMSFLGTQTQEPFSELASNLA